MVQRSQSMLMELEGKSHSESDLHDAIRKGFHRSALQSVLTASGLTLNELAACLGLSLRSLQRRKREGRLDPVESDRLYRLARIVGIARRSLGDDDRARRWLQHSNRALGGRTPLELIPTEPGARAVENLLGRIAYGGIS